MTAAHILTLLVGLAIGSFLNVCIFRIPRRLSLVHPRSRCPSCKKQIRNLDNIPVISYFLLRGRCRHCSAHISWVYPFVEASNGLIYVALLEEFGLNPSLLLNALLCSSILVLIFIDLFERILPDVITLTGTALGFVASPLQSPIYFGLEAQGTAHPGLLQSYWASGIGILMGGGILWLVAWLYLKVRKVEGLGFGDIKMMAMVGAFLGWRYAWLTIFSGAFLGALVGYLYIRFSKQGMRYELPFGSFLGIGVYISIFFGPELISWYLPFIGY